MIYILLVNSTIWICYGLYRILFRKLTFFQWNRFYLLGSAVLALLVPIGLFIDVSSNRFIEETIPTVDLSTFLDDQPMLVRSKSANYYIADFLVPIYWCGVFLATCFLVYKLAHIYRMIGCKKNTRSFTFFNKVVMRKDLAKNQTILAHEQVHARQGHTYDILFMEIFRVFNWFNPVLSLYVKELKFQHECIADDACSEDRVAYAELLIANALSVDDVRLLHEFSNESVLKKRIKMLFRRKSKAQLKYMYLIVAPVLALIGLSTLVFNTSKAKHLIGNIESKMENATFSDLKASIHANTISDHAPASRAVLRGEGLTSRANQTFLHDAELDVTAQKDTVQPTDDQRIFTAVEVNPEPIGGIPAFRKWIGEHYTFPEEAIVAKVSGQLVVSFVVERDGSLQHIKLVNDLGYGTGQAAVTLLKSAPKWAPGIQNGRKVRVAYTLPITLDLHEPKPSSREPRLVVKGTAREHIKEPEQEKLFTVTEVTPEPKMGLNAFRKWIGEHYGFPQGAIDAGVKGQIIVSFIVEADGKLTGFKVVKDLGHGTGQAAIDVLRTAEPWMPGVQNGRAVRVSYTLPITLNLEA
ncbi:TonB family protein [Sphingobacterium suaedae]|uniref:TonB family protein n=1 Tax=Sphingobacterium suaedae TaxID=1686402 RepID=A0ABW5KIW5_9SPHI